mgnify:CR=1 FL=1
MNKAKVSTILKCENLLGESCFWDPRYNCLVWTDIEAKKAWMLDDNNQSFTSVSYTHLRAHETR